jgi:anaerobic selenocysteine-containing dehydrogenase
VRGKERCTLHIHPDDAARIGVGDGESVLVTSRVGALTATAELTDAVMAGVVSLPYGWGHDAAGSQLSVASQRPGVNTNLLTDSHAIDPLSGNAVLNAIPVSLASV